MGGSFVQGQKDNVFVVSSFPCLFRAIFETGLTVGEHAEYRRLCACFFGGSVYVSGSRTLWVPCVREVIVLWGEMGIAGRSYSALQWRMMDSLKSWQRSLVVFFQMKKKV